MTDLPPCRTANKARLAEFFGVSLPAVDGWIRRGCPVLQPGSSGVPWVFDILAVEAWRAGRLPNTSRDFDDLPPREQLDFVRAQRENLKLGQEQRQLIPASEVERIASEAFKSLALVLSTLPDALERGCGLQPDAVARAQTIIDDARESLYVALVGAMQAPT